MDIWPLLYRSSLNWFCMVWIGCTIVQYCTKQYCTISKHIPVVNFFRIEALYTHFKAAIGHVSHPSFRKYTERESEMCLQILCAWWYDRWISTAQKSHEQVMVRHYVTHTSTMRALVKNHMIRTTHPFVWKLIIHFRSAVLLIPK